MSAAMIVKAWIDGAVDLEEGPTMRQPANGAEARHRRRASIPGDASRRFLEVITASGANMGGNDANTLLNSILLDARDLLKATRVAIMLYDAADRTVEILDIGAPAFPGRIVELGEGVAGRVIQSGQPLVIANYPQWQGKISGEAPGLPIMSAVAVPLRNRATTIGAMTAHSSEPDRSFTDDDAHMLEVFADVAMLALSHFSMYEELRTLNSRLGQRVRERTRALQQSTEEVARKNEQLQELIVGIGKVQNEERQRIAQDIHDGVMQTLTGAIFELKALETAAGPDGSFAPQVRIARELLRQLESELRAVIHDMQPVDLPGGGLIAAIESQAQVLQSRYGIRCRVQVFGKQRTLPHPVEVAALRIVKEALSNVQLHSSAILVDVELRMLRKEVRILVRDYGDGFIPDQPDGERAHLGISGMRRRAEALKGTFSLESTPGGGTVVQVSLPAGQWE
jgi:signal transduction histidine kinase